MIRQTAILSLLLLSCTTDYALSQTTKKDQSAMGLTNLNILETPHYRVYFKGKTPSTRYRAALEKTWQESAALLPRIAPIFEKGDREAEPNRDGNGNIVIKKPRITLGLRRKENAPPPFKLDALFVEDRYDFQRAARSLIPAEISFEDRQIAEAALETTSTFAAMDRGKRVYWINDPRMKSRDYGAFVAHCTATDLMHMNQGLVDTPFWIVAGYGYYMEFKLFKMSVTAYLDYDEYYREYERAGKGEFDKRDTLGVGKVWAPILKRIMKKGQKADLDQILWVSTKDLTPERCGYVYALVSFMLSDTRKAAGFAGFLMDIRDEGTEEQEKLLLKACKADSKDKFHSAWHKYILSSRFR